MFCCRVQSSDTLCIFMIAFIPEKLCGRREVVFKVVPGSQSLRPSHVVHRTPVMLSPKPEQSRHLLAALLWCRVRKRVEIWERITFCGKVLIERGVRPGGCTVKSCKVESTGVPPFVAKSSGERHKAYLT